jgi:hypothetical protein
MPPRKPFLLRVDPQVLGALERWAADELRSLNGQIEYLLRKSLVAAGRLKQDSAPAAQSDGAESEAKSGLERS